MRRCQAPASRSAFLDRPPRATEFAVAWSAMEAMGGVIFVIFGQAARPETAQCSDDEAARRLGRTRSTARLCRDASQSWPNLSLTFGPASRPCQRGGEGARRALKQEREARYGRSEEHTSELQSLMRISYAVFCLKKKKTQNNHQIL